MMKRLISTAMAAGLFCGAAIAQNNKPPLTQGHQDHVDTNDDGVVHPQEVRQFMTQAFGGLDKSGNGSLEPAETADTLSAAQFKTVDANKDGLVSQQEFLDQAAKDFAAADRNRDQQLK